jgi:uncharacterized metal-binding protein (TIGR02443 family)
MNSPKRFIAGAVCPKCAAMDRLTSYANDDGAFKECVACGFLEKQIVQIETNELDTRVNHFPEGEEEEQDDIQIVQLISPKLTKH